MSYLTLPFLSLLLISGAQAAEPAHSHHSPAPKAETSVSPKPEEAKSEVLAYSAARCSDMEVWDYGMSMCTPFPMAGMPMRMAMLHGNAFFNQTFASGPRGRSAFTIPNMSMLDLGTSLGDRHYFNVDLMLTAEKWTYPSGGYPELLQIGEENRNHRPYVDAQHPHSSPLMGLTFSDTIAFGSGRDHVKVFFAPRGESTDGPIAFMHRPTGTVNPDAPLGHHIGQDVGHISSTVAGASLRTGDTTLEASTFHGEEPSPDKVDLPIGMPNSYSVRVIHEFFPKIFAMASAAYVKEPEAHGSGPDHVWRYSASLYRQKIPSGNGWILHDAFIWGMIKNYDHVSTLHSFGKEFLVQRGRANLWGRLELLQRTPEQLALTGVADLHSPRWVAALTLGYTHRLTNWDSGSLGLGGSYTQDLLPRSYRHDYSGNPFSGKIFLQLSGMKMWDLL
ncbi:MAG: hypothetical protein AB7K68_14405 [Bacteriovoracia bacterium]